MRNGLIAIAAALLLAGCGAGAANPEAEAALAEQAKEQANKVAALDYYQALVGDLDYDKARAIAGDYIQHDPNVAGDGFDALEEYLTTSPNFKDRPKQVIEMHNVMADGDLVTFQVYNEANQNSTERRIVQHTFRFDENGKIAEHWSVVQAVDPASSKNPHPLW